ncbi:LDCC motif putative metal-binding protein [Clostridium kluyveri]|nr:LDCC motif putative metal-binding protein [Clostridium kluyveri]UZQ48905.1 LDCC motif putative metal-binding protein [Clostridium kluyveri]
MFKFLKKLIKKIEEENNKTFGAGKLDCCDLNKTTNISNKGVNKNK